MKRCKHFWGYIKPYIFRGRTMVLERCNLCGREKRGALRRGADGG